MTYAIERLSRLIADVKHSGDSREDGGRRRAARRNDEIPFFIRMTRREIREVTRGEGGGEGFAGFI